MRVPDRTSLAPVVPGADEGKLTPEEILKVMAYENTFAYDGEPDGSSRDVLSTRSRIEVADKQKEELRA